MKDAIVLLTHTWSPGIEGLAAELASIPGHDFWILSDIRNGYLSNVSARYKRVFPFHPAALLAWSPYSPLWFRSLRGHGHYPLLSFYCAENKYRHIWLIEYDVRFSGRWEKLIMAFGARNDDFISAHIRRRSEEPDWPWWNSFGHKQYAVSIDECLRSFNVCYRISTHALEVLDSELREGWYGHHEALVVSILHRQGCSILDMGGRGEFVVPACEDRWYTSGRSRDGSLTRGTLRFRPSRYKIGVLKEKLYHPVKEREDDGGFEFDSAWQRLHEPDSVSAQFPETAAARYGKTPRG